MRSKWLLYKCALWECRAAVCREHLFRRACKGAVWAVMWSDCACNWGQPRHQVRELLTFGMLCLQQGTERHQNQEQVALSCANSLRGFKQFWFIHCDSPCIIRLDLEIAKYEVSMFFLVNMIRKMGYSFSCKWLTFTPSSLLGFWRTLLVDTSCVPCCCLISQPTVLRQSFPSLEYQSVLLYNLLLYHSDHVPNNLRLRR